MATSWDPNEIEEGEIVELVEGAEQQDEKLKRLNYFLALIGTKKEDLREMRALKKLMLYRILDIRTALRNIEEGVDIFSNEFRYQPCECVIQMNAINTMFNVQDTLMREEGYMMEPLRQLTKWITQAKKEIKDVWMEMKDLLFIVYNICDDSEFFDEGEAAEFDIFDWD